MNLIEQCWIAYQEGQGSADHTAKEVFIEAVTLALEAKDAEIERHLRQIDNIAALSVNYGNEIREKDAEIEALNAQYNWLKSELRDNAKIIGEQQETIDNMKAVVDAAEKASKECYEMEFDHSNSCWNWAACEDSRRQCALCEMREALAKLKEST